MCDVRDPIRRLLVCGLHRRSPQQAARFGRVRLRKGTRVLVPAVLAAVTLCMAAFAEGGRIGSNTFEILTNTESPMARTWIPGGFSKRGIATWRTRPMPRTITESLES